MLTSMVLNMNVFSYLVKDCLGNTPDLLQGILGLILMFGPAFILTSLVYRKVKKNNIDISIFEIDSNKVFGYGFIIVFSFFLPVALAFLIIKFWL